jgi:sterol 3beta-glucosyltransferase
MTGQWFLDRPADWEPTDDLAGFLAAGPPPVYVGFGSIAGRSPSPTTSLVLKALQTIGQRGVIVTGWGGLCAMPAPASICFVESVPQLERRSIGGAL